MSCLLVLLYFLVLVQIRLLAFIHLGNFIILRLVTKRRENMKCIELLTVANDIVITIPGTITKQQAGVRTHGLQLMCLLEAHWHLRTSLCDACSSPASSGWWGQWLQCRGRGLKASLRGALEASLSG